MVVLGVAGVDEVVLVEGHVKEARAGGLVEAGGVWVEFGAGGGGVVEIGSDHGCVERAGGEVHDDVGFGLGLDCKAL